MIIVNRHDSSRDHGGCEHRREGGGEGGRENGRGVIEDNDPSGRP